MYDAIQKGFNHCTGEIMAWIGSDDMYHPKSFFTVADIFESLKDVRWIEGASTVFDKEGKTIFTKQSRCFNKYDFYLGNDEWIQQESTFWRRSLWEEAGGYIARNLKYAGDYELWLRFFRYDQLHVTSALIGGFRSRGEDQLSHIHMTEYKHEVAITLSKEVISGEDKKILHKHKKIQEKYQLLKKLHIPFAGTIKERQLINLFPPQRIIEIDSINNNIFIKEQR